MFGMSNEDLEEIIDNCIDNFETIRSNRYMNCAAIYAINSENKATMSIFMSEDSCDSIYEWFMNTIDNYRAQYPNHIIITLFFNKIYRKLSLNFYDK